MTYASLIEIVTATHLAQYVTTSHPQRGGLMLVSPAGQLKTSLIETLDHYPDAKVVSDLNVQSLIRMRDDLVAGSIKTLAFTDLEKIFKRQASVAANVEGILMALAEEGFRKASFQDQRMVAVPARATIVGGMTLRCYETHAADWADNGFARRFLFLHYQCSNVWKLEQAIRKWERYAPPEAFSPVVPSTRQIPYLVTDAQHRLIDRALKHQRSQLSPRVLLQKIASVLNWKFKKDEPRLKEIITDLAIGLGPNGAMLDL